MRRVLSFAACGTAVLFCLVLFPVSASGAWVSTGGPVGGIGYDVRIHPFYPDIMYVTDNFAGVIRSLDAGSSWNSVNSGITVKGGPTGDIYPIFCLTVDPNNPDILWAGTFSGNRTFGAFKSTDGGENWTAMNVGITDEGYGITFRGFTIQPGNSDIVYAQVELGTMFVGREFNRVRGRVYKTTNGGASWTAVWTGDNLARYLIIDPAHPETMYLSTGIFDREAYNSNCAAGVSGAGGVGVLKTTDGGARWSPVNSGLTDLYVGGLRMHPTDPKVLFAATGNNACSGQYDGHIVSGLFKTANGGKSWSKVIDGDIMTTVNFSPSHPNIVYAGSASAFYRSSNGGTTWTRYSKPSNREWGPPGIRAGVPIDVTVDPDDPDVLYANNYGGGVFRSTDGAKTWENWSRGYSGAEIHAVQVAGASGASVYAIGRSGPYKSDNYGIDWIGIGTGDANFAEWYAIAPMPGDSGKILVADEHQGCIMRSTNGGESFVNVFRHPDGNAAMVDRRAGFKALAFAPSTPSIVYAGLAKDRLTIYSSVPYGNVLYKSTNGGADFSAPTTALNGRNIFQLVVAPANADVVWAATSKGIYKTTNGGKSWAFFSSLGNRVIMALAVDPADTLRIVAAQKDVGIWKSSDGGASWTGGPYNTGLKHANPLITALAFEPAGGGTIYASDYYSGVYQSTDGGSSWSPHPDNAMSGLAVRAVQNLAVADGVVYAATQGGGVFRVGGPAVLPSPTTAEFDPAAVGASSKARRITVFNSGNAARTISGIEFTGTDAGDFTICNDYCSGTLPASQSCTFDIVFTPMALGARTAFATILSDDPVMPTYMIALNGTGTGTTDQLTPAGASIGTESVLTGSGFGTAPGTLYIGKAKCKTLAWDDLAVRWVLKKPMAPGAYDVTLIPKEPKGAPPIVISSCYTVNAPEISSITPPTGSVGSQITLSGRFFGTKKGKVSLVDASGKRIKCKVIAWEMDPATNEGHIIFSLPKKATGSYGIAVANKIGTAILGNAVGVE